MSKNIINEPLSGNDHSRDRNWIYFAVIALIGIGTAMLVPAITVQKLNPLSIYYSVFLATTIFSAIWWYRKKNVLLGAGIGVVLGVLLFILALLVSILAGTMAGT